MWTLWSILLLGVRAHVSGPRPTVYTKETVAMDDLNNDYLVLDEASRPFHQLPNPTQQTLREVARNMIVGPDSFFRIRGRLPRSLPPCKRDCTVFPSVELVRVLEPFVKQYVSVVQPGTSLAWNLTCTNNVTKDTDPCHVAVPLAWISETSRLLWRDVQRQEQDDVPFFAKLMFFSLFFILFLLSSRMVDCETKLTPEEAVKEKTELETSPSQSTRAFGDAPHKRARRRKGLSSQSQESKEE